ncbi:hypothetical protein BEWA_008200 [Theileria equi strain WA]|uniref:Histone acetyltransferase n=1 Tax=Theileria equi strain WA TaxID=1537102 RepID=L0B0T2_THEEQ|nr:hypothetical protein BEWA_008200 [Theileria equi strain WA]AFZ81410.1 hypothetical protein BEWA_008200 [Theileria equi strain WA]|eukprot:XP_004831076.1 hypothetical protein BEWA_008200 [Theileria equi strain WA]
MKTVMEDIFSVELHPCETIEDYQNDKDGYKPLFTHHFFNPEYRNDSIKWVKYDIYYLVDTFEIFIKVKGQLVNSCNRENIQEALSTVYKSVFKNIPEYTLIKDEQTFIDILLHKSSGTYKFIPPGRMVMENSIDDYSTFQLRYCTFKDEITEKDVGEVDEQDPGSIYMKSTLSKQIYFYDNSKSDKIDLSRETIEDLSKDGSFNNSVINEILESKLALRSQNSPKVKLSVQECVTDYSIPSNFKVLHRRIEWFYHWFIDGVSDITYDHRWVVLIPLVLKRNRKMHKPSETNSLQSALTSNEDFERRRIEQEYDIQTHITKQDLGAISMFNSESSGDDKDAYTISIVGMVTTYSYFTISGNRLRISQFMIMPNYSGKGFGLMVLEMIYRMAILDKNVREVSVEDPTSTFSILRYIVIMKMCFDSAHISPNMLYSDIEEPAYASVKEWVVKVCKESKYNASRIVEILQLTVILHPISRLPYTLTKTAPGTASDHYLKLSNGSEAYVNYVANLMKRIRSEEIRRLGKVDHFNLGTSSINAVNHVG